MRKNKKRKVFLIISIVAILIAIGIGVYFYLKKNGSSKQYKDGNYSTFKVYTNSTTDRNNAIDMNNINIIE